MLSFMQFISEMHGFHVGLGDINIDDGTGLKDSTSDCGVILHIYIYIQARTEDFLQGGVRS